MVSVFVESQARFYVRGVLAGCLWAQSFHVWRGEHTDWCLQKDPAGRSPWPPAVHTELPWDAQICFEVLSNPPHPPSRWKGTLCVRSSVDF